MSQKCLLNSGKCSFSPIENLLAQWVFFSDPKIVEHHYTLACLFCCSKDLLRADQWHSGPILSRALCHLGQLGRAITPILWLVCDLAVKQIYWYYLKSKNPKDLFDLVCSITATLITSILTQGFSSAASTYFCIPLVV